MVVVPGALPVVSNVLLLHRRRHVLDTQQGTLCSWQQQQHGRPLQRAATTRNFGPTSQCYLSQINVIVFSPIQGSSSSSTFQPVVIVILTIVVFDDDCCCCHSSQQLEFQFDRVLSFSFFFVFDYHCKQQIEFDLCRSSRSTEQWIYRQGCN